MIRDRVRTAQIVLLAVVVLGTVFVMDAVVGAGLVRPPYTVTVELQASGGLYPGSVVSYRGNRVGKVTDLDLTPHGVRATAALDRGTRIPTDSAAVVSNLSAVGEQRLDFRPRVDHGPWLEQGSVVAVADTALPLPTADLFLHLRDLTGQIDLDDVETVTEELAIAVGDPDLDLRRLYTGADRTLTMLEALQPETIALIERARVPLRTFRDHGDDLVSFSTDLRALSAAVRRANPDLARLVAGSNVLVPQLRGVINENADSLAGLLGKGRVVAEVGADRQPALMTWLDYVPLQARSMLAGTRDGSGRVVLVGNPSRLCKYATAQRLPSDTSRRAVVRDARCTLRHPVVQQRGAQYAPRP